MPSTGHTYVSSRIAGEKLAVLDRRTNSTSVVPTKTGKQVPQEARDCTSFSSKDSGALDTGMIDFVHRYSLLFYMVGWWLLSL